MPVLLCLVHANINACFLIAFVLFKILVRETKKIKNYNNIAYRFFLVNRYFLVIFILNSNVLQAFVTFTVRFINVSYFPFKSRTFRASPVLRYSNHLTFSCNDDGNHLLYKTIHVTFNVFTYMHDLVFIQMTCEDLYPDLFYITSYCIPLKCTMLWISKELIKFLSCILWLFGSTSWAELFANSSLKLWAGGMMGHGPAFVILMKRQVNCLSVPVLILNPCAASSRATTTTTFPWFLNYYVYVLSFLNTRLHPWLHPFQNESSTMCVCAQVELSVWVGE